ncbi:MAG: Ig-like domain-containing protein [Patescibacteria group bacterium]
MNRKLFFLIAFVAFFFVPEKVFAASAEFSISPASATLIRGCTQQARVMIQVDAATTNAADIIINYDTSKIEIIDAMPSIPGIQILSGDAFESYAGNIVNTSTGEIKLVGYSSSGTTTGSATFATILFKSLPLAPNGGFTFLFTGANPYNSLDSNIADATTSFDLLSGVSNSNYSFVNGSCASDTTAPTITYVSPKPLTNNILPNAPLVIKLEDTGSGILLPTLKIVVNGILYTSTSPEVSISGTPNSSTVTLLPATPFPTNAVSVVTVMVQDAAGNQRTLSTSYNSAYTCPSTIITNNNCPPTTTPSTDKEGTSPKITVQADTLINLKNPWKIKIVLEDSDGISLDSFSVTHGLNIYSFAGTPNQLTQTGTKTNYNVFLTLNPEDIIVTADGSIVLVIRVTDLKGNSRIETVTIRTNLPQSVKPIATTVAVKNDLLSEIYTYAITPAIIGFFVGYLILLTMQPVIAHVQTPTGKPVRFARGYYVFKNGKSQKLFGSYNGTIHGRIPRETVMLIIQKYGYKPQSVPISPSIKHNPPKISLSEI